MPVSSSRSLANAFLSIGIVIFVVFDAIDSPAHRLLPNAFYDFPPMVLQAFGLVMVLMSVIARGEGTLVSLRELSRRFGRYEPHADSDRADP